MPEETLYLMEKGALFCWKASRNDEPGADEDDREVEWDSASQGAPMSVQQAYAEMIGREHLTLDRYQVLRPLYSSPSLTISSFFSNRLSRPVK